MADKLSTNCTKEIDDFLIKPISSSFILKQVEEKTINEIINKLPPKTSSGYDEISLKLLKKLKNPLIKPLTVIVNQMINTGIFPQMLKIAKVVPLYKKGDKNLLINYRPISLLPSISKIFEKIIYTQMYKYFEENNLFFTSQYGFRTDHSTELAALEVADRIICNMDRGKIPFNIYLDLSKAFDTIDHKILLKKLDYYGIKGTSLNLIQSYLSNRKQFVNYNNTMSD